MNKKIPKVMVVGYGQMGKYHYNSLAELQKDERVQIGPVIDINKEKLSSLESNLVDTNFSRAFDKTRPDIVALATNTATHNNILETIVKSDQNPALFIEKPIVETSKDGIKIAEELREKGYGNEIPISFGYLIRQSLALKSAINYINSNKLKIKGFDVTWQKIRAPKRPSAGVHIDETTHSIDTILKYILPSTGNTSEAIILNNLVSKYDQSVVNVELQEQLYKGNKDKLIPMAQLEYDLSYSNIPIKGISSFMKLPFERNINISCEEKDQNPLNVKVSFDKDRTDEVSVIDHGRSIFYDNFSTAEIRKGNVFREWDSFLNYYNSNKITPDLATIENAVFDLKLTEAFGNKDLVFPYKIDFL
ncbi:Gfo/Idh/MocA family oxidoreductase [Nanoarchaeota archaeon]